MEITYALSPNLELISLMYARFSHSPFPSLAIRSSTTHWEPRPRDDRRLDGTSSSFHAALPRANCAKPVACLLAEPLETREVGKGKRYSKRWWVIYVRLIHTSRFREQTLDFLASCSSRRDWRAEARRARVASRGAAEARRSRLHARRENAPATSYSTSETVDAGVHVKATRGREEGTDAFGRVKWVS
jgi:hypothetical protein